MSSARRPPLPLPKDPPPGPFRRDVWRSPLRGPWLASLLSSALLPLIAICALTGFLSHAAYDPDLGQNSVTGSGGIGFDLYIFDWPSSPGWLYALSQGLHVVSGLAAIPILLAKLWTVIPKLFEWPPVRSLAHGVERLGLALLVGSSLFVIATGVINIQYWYVFGFSFVPAHYYGAFVFLAGLAVHVAVKLPTALQAFRERGVWAPLRDDLEHTRPEPPLAGPAGSGGPEPSGSHPASEEEASIPSAPGAPTISRRGLLATVGAASFGLAMMAAGQAVGGPLRSLGLLAPRGRQMPSSGPNAFPVNKTFAAVGIDPTATGSGWRLRVTGPDGDLSFSREQLLALPQATERLTIGCVEGWSTTQTWTGVRLRDLARLAGARASDVVTVQSLQRGGFGRVTLNPGQVMNPRSLLALRVNTVDLSLDHGFPARIIVPALPGVHNTKWVSSLRFAAA